MFCMRDGGALREYEWWLPEDMSSLINFRSDMSRMQSRQITFRALVRLRNCVFCAYINRDNLNSAVFCSTWDLDFASYEWDGPLDDVVWQYPMRVCIQSVQAYSFALSLWLPNTYKRKSEWVSTPQRYLACQLLVERSVKQVPQRCNIPSQNEQSVGLNRTRVVVFHNTKAVVELNWLSTEVKSQVDCLFFDGRLGVSGDEWCFWDRTDSRDCFVRCCFWDATSHLTPILIDNSYAC